mmetsp:Transcript_19707/g.43065  ORF Transcript_19707/g.43065 Transcript_19707/m.43065 type:complete len:215 (-) Transcript_19707:346-990(-)
MDIWGGGQEPHSAGRSVVLRHRDMHMVPARDQGREAAACARLPYCHFLPIAIYLDVWRHGCQWQLLWGALCLRHCQAVLVVSLSHGHTSVPTCGAQCGVAGTPHVHCGWRRRLPRSDRDAVSPCCLPWRRGAEVGAGDRLDGEGDETADGSGSRCGGFALLQLAQPAFLRGALLRCSGLCPGRQPACLWRQRWELLQRAAGTQPELCGALQHPR